MPKSLGWEKVWGFQRPPDTAGLNLSPQELAQGRLLPEIFTERKLLPSRHSTIIRGKARIMGSMCCTWPRRLGVDTIFLFAHAWVDLLMRLFVLLLLCRFLMFWPHFTNEKLLVVHSSISLAAFRGPLRLECAACKSVHQATLEEQVFVHACL